MDPHINTTTVRSVYVHVTPVSQSLRFSLINTSFQVIFSTLFFFMMSNDPRSITHLPFASANQSEKNPCFLCSYFVKSCFSRLIWDSVIIIKLKVMPKPEKYSISKKMWLSDWNMRRCVWDLQSKQWNLFISSWRSHTGHTDRTMLIRSDIVIDLGHSSRS